MYTCTVSQKFFLTHFLVLHICEAAIVQSYAPLILKWLQKIQIQKEDLNKFGIKGEVAKNIHFLLSQTRFLKAKDNAILNF